MLTLFSSSDEVSESESLLSAGNGFSLYGVLFGLGVGMYVRVLFLHGHGIPGVSVGVRLYIADAFPELLSLFHHLLGSLAEIWFISIRRVFAF